MHWSLSLQTTGAVGGWHTPAVQVRMPLHMSPSSQLAPLALSGLLHVTLHTSSVHGLPSLHWPAFWQVAAPSHVPFAGLQVWPPGQETSVPV